jgi:hypothetical protein
MIEGSVHRIGPSIFLNHQVISFRFTEDQMRLIVNSIEHGRRLDLTKKPTPSASKPEISGQQGKETSMSILLAIGRIATEYHAARARYQTERAILSLPIELQKDIGWPQTVDCPNRNQRGAGTWAGEK